MLLLNVEKKGLDREYLCMYVGSISMPTVVELNGTESKVCLILPKKNQLLTYGPLKIMNISFQVTFLKMILVFKLLSISKHCVS